MKVSASVYLLCLCLGGCVGGGMVSVPGPPPATSSPAANFSSMGLTFSTQLVATTSAAQTVTLTDNGIGALSITSIVPAGANSGDFSETNTCGASVAASAKCMITVTFTPSAAGSRTASITITDNATGSPQTISLSGTGVNPAPVASLSGASLTFSTQVVSTSSAVQTVTLTNNGTAALNIASIGVSGTNGGDFAAINTCGTSLAVNALCTISVTFTPSGVGNRTASISIIDNAAGSPQVISLAGVGAAGPPPPPPQAMLLGQGREPVIAVDGQRNVDVAWLADDGVHFARSIDGGQTFKQTLVQPGILDYLQMAVDSLGRIDLVWLKLIDPFVVVSFSRSTDGGATFSAPTNLSPGMAGIQSFRPQLAVDGLTGNIYVSWFDFGNSVLSSIHSTDGGATFSAPVQIWTIPHDGTVHDGLGLNIAAGQQGQLYSFWMDEGQGSGCQIIFSVSLDGGLTFGPATNISNSPSCSADPRAIVDPKGNTDVTWHADTSIFFSRSTDQGQTFFAPTLVSNAPAFFVSGQQAVVEADGSIDVAWTATIVDFTVLLARSTNNGATFSAQPVTLSLPPRMNATGAGDPSIGACGSGVSVAWQDDGNSTATGTAANSDIFLDRVEGGVAGSSMNLSDSPHQADVSPKLAVDQGNVFVVWATTTNGGDPTTLVPTKIFFRAATPCRR